ncbi:hypothetical protein FNV43_RR26199 [Rhamnella rubrinervis]|uniref:Uncharacterized protein n=1 Tax=Rhamnella rubrinervis TaxID=2594499 RepID=A0A8K0DM42_9ROSA|nr:hypothetical protein FNV43_RR26199 [Rhamnella rubrinervis]
MKKFTQSSIFIKLLIIQFLAIVYTCHGFDFFYFWPGSLCDAKRACCLPTSGKPATDFGIHGLWPTFNNGSYPANCNANSPFDGSKISDLTKELQVDWPSLTCPSTNSSKFWTHEWVKHGTCSESVLDQHAYFEANLNLKHSINLLGVLQLAGIQPNGKVYSLQSVRGAIKAGTGYTPVIECNLDASNNSQLYQVYLCVDKSGSKLIECPVLPKRKCASFIEFPSF